MCRWNCIISTQITGGLCHRDTECADRIVHSLQRLLVSRATVILNAPMELYILYRLMVVGATEIQNALTGLYTLQRLLVSRATVILNVPMEFYNLYTDYWWLEP